MSILIIGVFTFGCITPAQRGPSLTETPPAPQLIAPEDLEMRIADLNRMLASNDLDEHQREIAYHFLALYEKIRQTQMDCPDTLTLVLDHLNDINDTFLKNAKTSDSLRRHIIQQFLGKRRQIFDDYLYGNFQGVIDGAVELETSFGADALTPEIGLVFAVSLAKKGMLEEALSIAAKILGKLQGKPDMVHLRAYMIEWQLGIGKREKALQIYEKLLDDLDERNGLLSKAQRNLALKTNGVASRPDIPITEKSNTGEVGAEILSIDQLIGEVERLLVKNEYQQAKILLVRRRLKTQDDAEIVLLDQAFQRVERAEADFRVQGQGDTLKKDPLRVAKTLIDVEEFEKAIDTINALETNAIVSPEATKLKTLATEGLISRERNSAAKLFLMAKNTQDPLKKKDYLLSAHAILKHLDEKYPLSILNKKIKNNIETVENEMIVLGIFPE